ncbi:MAG: beta-L-arabinofuranosidase domain-containing protein, partial [Acidobacteriaceae bacterium]
MQTRVRKPPFSGLMTRREVMRAITASGMSLALPGLLLDSALADTSQAKPVVKDRVPLAPAVFFALPLGSIRPRGWLLEQLRIQANGLSGHLSQIWPDVGPNSGWLGGSGESWERGPYYLDGLLPLAFLVDDKRLKEIAQTFIDWTLQNQWPNGMIGPRNNDDWWPRIVMLKALTQYQEITSDPRVIPIVDRYFRFQLAELPRRPLRDWARFRWQDELLSVIWLYNRTGAPYLLDLARLLHVQGYDWIGNFETFRFTEKITAEFIRLNEGGGLGDLALATHGVNNGQAVKCGPVWSQISGAPRDRRNVFQAIADLNRYHGLPNGMFSCSEHLAGRDPSQGSELCTVVEYMFSLERSLAITGDASLADQLEKLAYNALPGTLTDDMWAHQYNQEPNQVECSLHQRPWVTDGPESNLFGLAPNFGCCTANYHQGWPKFANSLWMLSGRQESDNEDGLAAVAYAPCEVQTLIRGIPVRVTEETDYPFTGRVQLTIVPASPTAFSLQLRIPGWARGVSIRVNDEAERSPNPGAFARVQRTWSAGDRVEIHFAMNLRTSR